MFGIWAIATTYVCFQRPDYVNVSFIFVIIQLTTSIMGLFLFLDPQQMKKSYLRSILVFLILTEVFDILWVVYKNDEYWGDQTENGMSQVIIMFIYVLLIYKLFLVFVLWKASLNFEKFVRQQRELVGIR